MATIPVSRHGDSPDGSSHGCKGPLKYLDLKVGDVDGLYSEGSTRWGVKQKVDAVSELTHTYSEHCDRHLRDKLKDLYLRRVLASNSEVSLVPFNFMPSQERTVGIAITIAVGISNPSKTRRLVWPASM
jgi:hypothetical protein